MMERSTAEAPMSQRSEQKTLSASARDFAVDWIETRYGGTFFQATALPSDTILDQLAALRATDKFRGSSLTVPASLCEAGRVFCDELIEFFIARSNKGTETVKLEQFSTVIQRELFSDIPNICDCLNIKELFLFAARFTQVPEAQTAAGASILDSLIRRLSRSTPDTIDFIASHVNAQTIDVQLDILHQTKTVVARALAYPGCTDNAVNLCLAILDILPAMQGSPLVEYASVLARERILEELQRPSLHFVRTLRNRAEGRVAEFLQGDEHLESVALKRKISMEDTSLTVVRIAQDGIALCDQSLVPQQLGQVDFNALPEQQGLDQSDLAAIETYIHETRKFNVARLAVLIEYVNATILPVLQTGTQSPSEIWSQLVPNIEPEKWNDVLEATAIFQSHQLRVQEYRSCCTAEADAQCQAAGQNFLNKFALDATVLLKLLPDDTMSTSRAYYAEYRATIDSDSERALSAASNCVLALSHPVLLTMVVTAKQYDPAIAERELSQSEQIEAYVVNLLASLDQLETTQLKSRVAARIKREALPFAPLPSEISMRIDTFLNEQPHFIPSLLEGAQQLHRQVQRSLPAVAVFKYGELQNNRELFPFVPANQGRVSLLLKHLHHPAMRALIEDDLGIELRTLPLRSQVHFLRYLENQDRPGFDRIRSALQRHSESSNEILCSFLANAEHERFCEPIIRAAELLEPEYATTLFRKYNEIVAGTQSIRAVVTGYLEESETIDDACTAVSQSLIGRANRILESYVRQLEKADGNSALQERILERLSVIQQETALIASVYRELVNHRALQLEHVKDLSIEVKSASELSGSEKKALTLINEENCIQNEYPPALAQYFSDSLGRATTDPRSIFYLLQYKGKIVSMQRFLPLTADTMYHASFNTTIEAKGSGFGAAFFASAVAEMRKSHNLEGAVYTAIPAASHYLEKQGFHIIEEVHDFHGTGATVRRIGINKIENGA